MRSRGYKVDRCIYLIQRFPRRFYERVMRLKIYEVANLHIEGRSDTMKYADADVGFSKFNTRYVGFALCTADHRSEFGLR